MHDIKTLKATPGLARRLLEFSQMNHMTFGEDLIDLAMQNLVSLSQLAGFPKAIGDVEMSALQFVQDWDGRAMLLCNNRDRARNIALANAWLNGGITVVMAEPKEYAAWAQLVRDVWPDAKISVFGNPRYQKQNTQFPDGVEFEERPDTSADFFITSYGGVIWHNLLNTVDVSQTIIEELDKPGTVNYKWDSAVKAMFHETPRPLFIQNVNSLPNDDGRDIMASLNSSNSRALSAIGITLTNYMWAGINSMCGMILGMQFKEIEDYLVSRGYVGASHLKMLSTFGISSHLLDDVQGHKKPITFYDNSVRDAMSSGRRNASSSGLSAIFTREQAIESHTGAKLDATITDALNGHKSAETLVGGLMTSQWANLKGRHLKGVHAHIANRTTRSLFLADHVDLKRTLLMQFGLQMEDLSTATDREFTMTRFTYPTVTKYAQGNYHGFRPLSNLIVTLDDLIQEPNLLQVSHFLFLAQPPMSQDYLDGIREAAAMSGTRVVSAVLRNTFEELISKQLR